MLSCYIISIVTLSRLSCHSVSGNERQLSRASHRTCAEADTVKLPHPCPCSGSLFTLDNVCFYEVPGENEGREDELRLVPEEGRESGPCGVFISEIIS